jgi:predicted nucleic acid-binding protein
MAGGSERAGGRRFVLDCSVALAWCFPDEKTKEGDALLRALKRGAGVVPALWFLEVANALLSGERRGRLPAAVSAEALGLLRRLPIEADDRSGFPLAANLLALARAYRLSAYDAAYLEVAQRLSLPLATFDEDLQAAAKALGVKAYRG